MKTNYSDEEWRLVSAIPQLISYAVASAAYSGVLGTAKEALASMKGMIEGTELYGDNGLIGSIAPDQGDMEAAKEASLANKSYLEALKNDYGVVSKEDMSALTLKKTQEALALIDERELEKVAVEFRHWVYQIGENVSNAAKEGGFLGFGGTRVSEGEATFLKSLKEVLAIDSHPL